MLINPFTPSEIASAPSDFFGRIQELETLERSLGQGSVAIQGAIGIGKSSLLARARLLMEGFDSSNKSRSVIAVGDKDIHTIDELARLVLESFVTIDEKRRSVKFRLGAFFEIESSELCRFFVEGRHLAFLKRIVEEEYLSRLISTETMLIFGIDEADKCPIPLARFIRSLVTHTQQQGIKRVRFVMCGVSPFFQQMVEEDPGINRFIYKTLTLSPLSRRDTADLIDSKFSLVLESAKNQSLKLTIDPDIATRIMILSGGHPHIIQLLGSHLIENECEHFDGKIDARDLVNSLRRICFEDRARVYDSTVHFLQVHNKLDSLLTLFRLMPEGFPSSVSRLLALRQVEPEDIQWLVDHQILSTPAKSFYGLVDEFLRVRFLLDQAESPKRLSELEKQILELKGLDLSRFNLEDS